jgi:tripartite-type tricarboxylate transporter receptor subunit TctC
MQRIVRALSGLLLMCAAGAAQAQTYPDRPIRLVVSIAAGSVTDVIMRKAAADLQPRLGQPLIVENRGGAAGILGAQTCAQAAPDGYTLCVIYHSTMSYNPLLFDKLPYQPEDIAPVTRLFFLTEGLFVSSEVGINSVAELKAYAQAKPDGLNYATLGDGSFPDLFMRWLNNQWGTKIVGVPYKGGGPAAQALAGNQVQVTRFGVGNFMGMIDAGKVKARYCRQYRHSRRPASAVIRAKAGGASPCRRAHRRPSSTRSTPRSSRSSRIRRSMSFSTSSRWCRQRQRRPASRLSFRKTARPPRRWSNSRTASARRTRLNS